MATKRKLVEEGPGCLEVRNSKDKVCGEFTNSFFLPMTVTLQCNPKTGRAWTYKTAKKFLMEIYNASEGEK